MIRSVANRLTSSARHVRTASSSVGDAGALGKNLLHIRQIRRDIPQDLGASQAWDKISEHSILDDSSRRCDFDSQQCSTKSHSARLYSLQANGWSLRRMASAVRSIARR
jgi:hypothetical protein